jgi:glucose/arabinose dehydrogenase/4-amino-4-deoxy-L-arabinose transferase-like glycosyltransferase
MTPARALAHVDERIRRVAMSGSLVVDVIVVGALVAGAFLMRLAYLWEIPRFTDEVEEVIKGLAIARGEILPLINQDPYIGALWNYVIAALFLVTGPSMYSPRLLVAALGALTVVPTYLLGRDLGGRIAGVVGAVLLAASPVHIAINSHIAWSNCITPLFVTIGLWLLYRAVARDRPRLLVGVGVSFGLAAQTHPIALFLVPGLSAYLLYHRPAWLRGPWPYVAALAATACVANLIAFNLLNRAEAAAAIAAVQSDYAANESLSIFSYLQRLNLFLRLMSDSAGGVLSENQPLVGPMGSPVVLGMSLLAILGLELTSRRNGALPLVIVLSLLFTLPLVNGRFESSMPKARYVSPVLPLLYVSMGVVAAYVFESARTRTTGLRAHLRAAGFALIGIGLVASATLMPALNLVAYYRGAIARDHTNAALFDAVESVEIVRGADDVVFVDRALQFSYTLGGGRLLAQFQLAGAVGEWQTQVVDIQRTAASNTRPLIGVLVAHPTVITAAERHYSIESVRSAPASNPLLEVAQSSRRLAADDQVPTVRAANPPASRRYVSGLLTPAAMVWTPDGRLFVSEVLAGRVRIVQDGRLRDDPFVVLPTTKGVEQGTLGLAIDPEFARNRWVYVFYSEADENNVPRRNRVVRYTERDGRATEPTPIVSDIPINTTQFYKGSHNGGRLAFGPDGMLYIAVGEVARRGRVQDPREMIGKILRVTRDGSIPADNPWPGTPTWALGFRNVWGMNFEAGTGRLYATDNGPRGFDELNLVQRGGNFAYPFIEGGRGGDARFIDPLWDSDDERLGITGLAVYDGDLFPEYRGDLFFCAYNDGALRRVRLGGANRQRVDLVEIVNNDCRLDVAVGPEGGLYFSDFTTIHRLER